MLKYAFAIFLLPLTYLFSISNSYAGIYDPDSDPNFVLGAGYDVIKAEVRGDCVVAGNLPEDGPGGENVTFSLRQVEDSNSLRQSLKLSASASLAGAVGRVRGKASLLKTINVNDYSLYILASVRVEHTPVRMRATKLMDSAWKLLEKRGEAAFKARCGDEFVAGWITGGEYHAILEIQTRSSSDKQRIATELSGSMGVVSAEAKFSGAIQEISKSNRMQVHVYRSGGFGEAVQIDPQKLIEDATTFPKIIRGQGARRVAVLTQGYDILDMPEGKTPIDTNVQRDVLERLLKYESSNQKLLSNIDYMLANPAQFKEFGEEEIISVSAAARKNLNDIRDIAKSCYRNHDSCRLPENREFVISGFNLPTRKELTDQVCKQPVYNEKRDTLCGVESYQIGTGKICGPDKFRQARGKACGVESYKIARTSACGVERYKRLRTSSCPFGTWHHGRLIVLRKDLWKVCKKQGADGTHKGKCKRYKHCRHRAHGVERYKSCRAKSHGIAMYKKCENKEFGVASFKSCTDKSFGVASYLTCRRKEFGLEKCLRY